MQEISLSIKKNKSSSFILNFTPNNNMKNLVYIYYHMDFDGLVSSALAYHFFKERGFIPQIERPIDFNIKSLWEKGRINVRKPFAIVDFSYRKDAFAYFDHHSPNKPSRASPETKYLFFDKEAKSCASLIFRILGDNNRNEKRSELVRWCDIIDTVSYAHEGISIQDQLYPKEPAIILSKSLETARIEGKERFWNSLSEKLIKNASIEEILEDEEVLEKYKTYMKNQEGALCQLKSNSEYESTKGIVTYDATKNEWSRFGLAAIYPDSLVWIGLIRTQENLVDISICQNPWNPKSQEALEQTHIGDILKKYGGGGNKFRGGVHFNSHKKAKESMCKIKKHITKNIIR